MFFPHLACKYETKQYSDGKLAVTEEYNVEEVGVRRVLEEKPADEVSLLLGALLGGLLTWIHSGKWRAETHCRWSSR